MRLLVDVAKAWPKLLLVGTSFLLVSPHASGQELKPTYQLSVDEGDWTRVNSWSLRGTDPPETGTPGANDIASIINRGVVNVNANGAALKLNVNAGTVNLLAGNALTVAEETVVGPNGVLSLGGGTLETASLAMLGTIDLPADAAFNTVGTSWPVATAGLVQGSPSRVTVGGALPDIDLGLALQFGQTDTGASVTVGREPVLVITRATGEARIENFNSEPVDIKGYTIGSLSGKLARGGRPRWDSFEDQDVPGWEEAKSTLDTRFTEYNLTGTFEIGANSAMGIGTPYGAGVGLSPSREDVTFEYIRGDGEIFNGRVHYEGPVNDLVLFIDPATGNGTIANPSGIVPPYDITAFSILSSSGSLESDNFADFGVGWENANPSDSALSQLNLFGSQVFAENGSVEAGQIFDTSGDQDLVFQFATAAGIFNTGTVIYEPFAPGQTFLPADFNENGTVDFPDFLLLSELFGQTVDPAGADPDINGNGTVDFPDFLELSNTFGQSSAASVPEPSTGFLMFLGFFGMLQLRKRSRRAATLVAAACIASASLAQAEDFDVRFIRLHPDGPNSAIGSTLEAQAIVNGDVFDILKNDDITSTVEVLDFGGGDGDFTDFQVPYPNDVSGDGMTQILVHVTGVLEIPEGDWTIGCGSDDGCLINMPAVEFLDTYNENGPTTRGDGQMLFNGGRGHDWTFGTFTVPSGGLTTGFEALMYEGAGGDSFEVAILDDHILEEDTVDGAARRAAASDLFLELADGELEWEVTGAPFMAGSSADFNGDGVVDDDDAKEINRNFGSAGSFEDGDISGDGFIDFEDLSQFFPIYLEAQPAAPSPCQNRAHSCSHCWEQWASWRFGDADRSDNPNEHTST